MLEADRSIDPARLNALLRGRYPDVDVDAVDVLDDTSGSANRLRLRITYRDGASAGLPDAMFLKRNLPRFSFPAEMYSTEVRVYRDVLPGAEIEAPAVYAIEAGDGDIEFTLLLEDLGARPGCRLGFVLDATSADEVDTVLTTLARLHAQHWGGGPSWAKLPASDPSMSFWREVGPRLVQRHLERGHRAPFADRMAWTDGQLWQAFDALLIADGDGATTFLHGDVHAGNVYYLDGSPGRLLDWQLSLRGSWALDVGYLLTSALTIEDRRTHESELLDTYLGRLRDAGIDPPSRDEAWLRYRQNALYGLLMWLITPDGVHTDAAQTEYMQRCLTAVEDLETLDALVR